MPQRAERDPAALAQALGHLECLPLGAAMILHNRRSGAIVASNAFGAMLIDDLRQTPDVDAVVRKIAAELGMPEPEVRAAVAATLARWTEDGVFLTALQPFAMPVPYRPPRGAVEIRLAIGVRTVWLSVESAELADDIRRAVAPMGLAVAGAGPAVRLEAIEANGIFGVFRDGEPVWGAAPYELTRFHLLREIMDVLCGPQRVSAHLHASAVAKHGAALVFAGASGSGKSTLATALIGDGAALVSDDHVALDAAGAAVLAFPTRPNLKPGAGTLPGVGEVIAAQRDRAGAFVPKARVPAGEPVRLAGLVFPRYGPDADNALTPLDPEEALRVLIQTGSRVSRSTGSIAPLLKALAKQPTCALSYRDTAFAVAQCQTLLAG